MRVELNLATRPFGRSRLFWTASAAIGAVLLVITAGLLYSFWRSGKLPPELAAKETQLRAELTQLTSEETQAASALRQPETLDVYDRSYFLNQLLTRKGISWTKTFGDLEGVLPPRVLVMTTTEVNGRGYRYPRLVPGCTGCKACSQICPDFVFQVYKFEEPVEL